MKNIEDYIAQQYPLSFDCNCCGSFIGNWEFETPAEFLYKVHVVSYCDECLEAWEQKLKNQNVTCGAGTSSEPLLYQTSVNLSGKLPE